jgi:hypothetical protein
MVKALGHAALDGDAGSAAPAGAAAAARK